MATVLFALSCLGLPELLTGGHLSAMRSTFPAANGATIAVPPLDFPAWLIAAGVVNWLFGLAIVILLWQRAASRYYQAVSLSQRRPVYTPYAAPGYGAPGYAPPGYAPPGYAPPGSPQWQQPYGQPPPDPWDPQAPPRPPLACRPRSARRSCPRWARALGRQSASLADHNVVACQACTLVDGKRGQPGICARRDRRAAASSPAAA